MQQTSGVVIVVVELMAWSMKLTCTSRLSNCCSNLVIIADICSRFIEAIAESIDRTTLAIDDVTCFIDTAVCTRCATASMREDILR